MESSSRMSAFRRLPVAALFACLVVTGCAPGADTPQQELEQEGESVPIPDLSPGEKTTLDGFVEPQLSAAEEASVLARYGHLDPNHLVPDALLKKAVTYFDANKSRLSNTGILTVVDFSPHSSKDRMFLVNVINGSVIALHMAHGSGSDPDNDGYANKFSNVSGSNMSSVGYYRAAEAYTGKHGLSVRLDGLSKTNSNARARAIVVHSATYVSDSDEKQGRSNGCLAVSEANRTRVMNMIRGGSLVYAGLSK